MRSVVLAVLLLAVLPIPTTAADLCPCVPISHLWTVKTCPDWNCAATELAVANGNAGTFAVPYAIDDKRWVVLTRVATGSYVPDESDPIRIDEYDGIEGATTRYRAINADHHPMLLTSPDGKVIVMSLRQPDPRRRAVGGK